MKYVNKKMKEWLLRPKALPETVHYKNIRTLQTSDWNNFRIATKDLAGYKCQVCESTLNNEVHEIFTFDFPSKIATIDNLVCLCKKCHQLQHMFFWEMMAKKKPYIRNVIETHYNKLTNNCLSYHSLNSMADDFYIKHSSVEWKVKISNDLYDRLEWYENERKQNG